MFPFFQSFWNFKFERTNGGVVINTITINHWNRRVDRVDRDRFFFLPIRNHKFKMSCINTILAFLHFFFRRACVHDKFFVWECYTNMFTFFQSHGYNKFNCIDGVIHIKSFRVGHLIFFRTSNDQYTWWFWCRQFFFWWAHYFTIRVVRTK